MEIFQCVFDRLLQRKSPEQIWTLSHYDPTEGNTDWKGLRVILKAMYAVKETQIFEGLLHQWMEHLRSQEGQDSEKRQTFDNKTSGYATGATVLIRSLSTIANQKLGDLMLTSPIQARACIQKARLKLPQADGLT
ncbi:hypothetical protein ABE137_04985 [Brevibacillus laterosporus]|uniref:hypothetical protein n=1 Tax=Brevibacillus laterosporus TaxID=1465 RepID=UPI003D2234BB